jgi:transcriptional repressor NF-X1
LTCPCGRLTQAAKCGLSSLSESDPSSHPLVKCTNKCEVAKRNARLAEALGITSETRERASKGMAGGPITYSDEVVAFAKEDSKFMSLVEKTFSEYVSRISLRTR